MKWTVSHWHQNPRHNTTETFTNRGDAEACARGRSDDSDTPGVSTIESDAGHYGRRKWNATRIHWITVPKEEPTP